MESFKSENRIGKCNENHSGDGEGAEKEGGHQGSSG